MLIFRYNSADAQVIGKNGIIDAKHPPTGEDVITAGMRGKQVVLEFSPEWAGLAKTVVFSNGEKSRDVVFGGNPVTIPAEILEEPLKKLTVGVYGVGDRGQLAIPTVRALGPVILPGALPSGEAAEETVTPLWEQIHAQLGDLSRLDTEAKESLVAAVNEILEKYGKIMNPDKTLTLEGVAADAGAVGDRFSQFEEAVDAELRDLRTHYKGVLLVEVADGKASHSAGEIREAAEAGMLPAAWGQDAEGAFFGVLTRFREEKALFVYPTVEANTATVKGVEIDGDKNAAPYEDYHKNPPAQGGVHGGNVVSYGALGDGTTDDTLAFQRALAENRVVYVPGGTYKLSGELRIRGNCELQLNQDTVLEFTQTSGNCVSLEMSASIRGHHGLIKVPYGFSGNVINVTTALNEDVTAIEPWNRWDPMWKAGRYITDLNITKHDPKGFCYANQPGDCKGTAIYISADRNGTSANRSTFIWGLDFSGIRIAGAFSYGIRAVNYNDAWNHEMRIGAFITCTEIGVSLEDCHNAYISAVIEPRYAENTSGTKTGVYAKHGIQLIRSTNADLTGSRVWDWNETGTKWQSGNQWQHIGMYGDCHGAILNSFEYYDVSADIRSLIYTDTPGNLEKLTILQEPFTRWFKPRDGKPYFFDGEADKELTYKEDFDQCFIVDKTATFTDALAKAIDSDGSIYNGIGYSRNGGAINGSGVVDSASSGVYGHTGFIAVKDGSTVRVEGMKLSKDGNTRIAMYDADFNLLIAQNSGNIIPGTSYFFPNYAETENGFSFRILAGYTKCAYIRMSVFAREIATTPLIAIDEEIGYTMEGYLADGIKVKGKNVVGGASGGGVTSWNDLTDKPFGESDNAVLLPKTQFAFDSSLGLFYTPGYIEFVPGDSYTVNWNGVDYTTEAVPGQFNGTDLVMLGNPAALGGENNNLPFAVACLDNAVGAIPLDDSSAVNVGISGYELKKIPARFLTVQRYDIYLENAVWDEHDQTIITCDTTELVDAVLTGGLVYVHLKEDNYMALRMLATMVYPVTLNAESATVEEALAEYAAEYGKENVPFLISCHNAARTFTVCVNWRE